MKNCKICVMGLDGVNRQVLDMINLKSGMNKFYSDMISTIPPYTPPAWTSIVTGVNPGKHGIFGFYNVKNGQISLANSFNVKHLRLFEIADLGKLKSIVVNVPMSYPFEGIQSLKNTTIVTDWASPVQSIYPERIFEKYKEYLIEPPNWNPAAGMYFKYSKDYNEVAHEIQEYLKTRLNLYYDLLENFDWNLFFIVFSETDWLLHRIPRLLEGKRISKVQSIFRELRNFFKRACEVSDFVFVVSDHGFEIKKQKISINALLLRNNMLKLRYSLKKSKSKNERKNFIQAVSQENKRKTNLESLMNILGNAIPKGLLKVLIRKLGRVLPIFSEIDWINSDAYMFEHGKWGIYVNRNLERVKRILESSEGISKVVSPKEIYYGPHLNNAPDLVLIPEEGILFDVNYRNEIHTETYEADHEKTGVFLVVGDLVRETAPSKVLNVYDVTPTILHIFGLPIPNDADGRVLTAMFEPDSELTKRKPTYVELSYYAKKAEEDKLKAGIKKLKTRGKI